MKNAVIYVCRISSDIRESVMFQGVTSMIHLRNTDKYNLSLQKIIVIYSCVIHKSYL